MNHAMTFRSDDYEVTLTLKDPRSESLTHWAMLVEAVMLAVQTGQQIVLAADVLPPPFRTPTALFLPERHGTTTVSTDSDAQMLSSMFDGITVEKGDRLVWGIGTEGER